MTTKTLWRVLALLFAFALVAAACGSDDDGDDGSGDSADDSGTTETSEAADDDAAGDDGGDDESGDEAAPAGDPEPTDGFDGETITLGYLTDETGPLSILGVPLSEGSQAYWDWINDEGGIAGQYPVELEVADTGDQEGTAVEQYQRLKEDVVMFAQVLSTPPTQAVLEFLVDDDKVAVPGSLALAWSEELNLLPNGASYEHEMINLADWYVNQSGSYTDDSVMCAVTVNDSYGEAGLNGINHAAENLGFELAELQTISRTDTAFDAVASSLANANCEAIFAVTISTGQNGLMAAVADQGLDPVWLGALPTYQTFFAQGNPDRYANFYVALDAPNFNDVDVPGMAEFLEVWEQYGEGEPNTFVYSGYFQQISVKELLELAVSKGDLSPQGILDAQAELGEVDVKGLTAENYVYGLPENREPTSATRIFHFDETNPPNLLTEVAIVDSELNETYELPG